MNLKFVAHLPPSINEYRKYRVIYTRGKPTVQTYKTKETYQYEAYIENLVKQEIELQGWVTPPKGTYVYVWLTFYFSRTNQDDNNYYKVLCDSLQKSGVVHNDSKFIIRTKDIFVESKNPRIEVFITPAKKIGIFKDSETLNSFVERYCLTCKKKNHIACKFYKNAIQNKIDPDGIDKNNLICKKHTPKKVN